MEKRDLNLMNLRPNLGLAPASGKIEEFQNKTLRPILKFQNDLLLKIGTHQFKKRKSVFFGLEELKQLAYIEQEISRDNNFKNLLLGLIIGHFTLEEYHFFKEQEQELRKRITKLLIQRFQSQVSSLNIE